MKKLHFFSVVCLLALFVVSLAGCKKEEVNNNGNNNGNTENPDGGSGGGSQTGYVDLGLPSGTKWKSSNEMGNGSGFYTFDEAVSAFGSQLPTKEQCEELIDKCTWTWQSNGGYKVTGPNGNSIILPAAGGNDCDGNLDNVGTVGYYRSSTPYSENFAWYICFYSDDKFMFYDSRCYGLSVRLVQK